MQDISIAQLMELCTVEGKSIILPDSKEFNCPDYSKFKKAMLKIGGEYKKEKKVMKFSFEFNPKNLFGRLKHGADINIYKEYQFFPTPIQIVEKLVAGIDFKGLDVLEPSAGRGAIADYVRNAGASVTCVELMRENCEILEEKGYVVTEVDFLRWGTNWLFHWAIANPPFSKNQDIKHFVHMTKFASNVRAILSANAFENARKQKGLQYNIFRNEEVKVLEELPAGAFKETGTNVPTIIVEYRSDPRDR